VTGRLRWLAVAAIVLLAGYGVMLALWPEARPSLRFAPRQADKSGGRASQQRPYEKISAEIVIPSAAECGSLTGCPKTRLGAILGVGFSNPHGLTIGSVEPDGPAAAAGLKQGDQLGHAGECPSSTIGYFLPDEEPRTVSVTVRRWRGRDDDSVPDGEPAAAPEKEAEPPSKEEPGPSP